MTQTRAMRKYFALSVAALFGLAACGSEPAQTDYVKAAADIVKLPASLLRAKAPTSPQGIGLTRARLSTLETPVDLVTFEQSGAQGVIAKVGDNQGVETWSSLNQKTLSFRRGVLVATRGLGPDVISAVVPSPEQLAVAGTAYRRAFVFLGDEDQPQTLRFDCQVSLIGPESLTIVERRYETRHLRENCTGPSGGFENDYWFESNLKLRQSRQWMGKEAGSAIIQQLKD
jgi:hypothetical protein